MTIDLRIKNENCRVSCRFAAIKGHKFHHHIASEFVVDAARAELTSERRRFVSELCFDEALLFFHWHARKQF